MGDHPKHPDGRLGPGHFKVDSLLATPPGVPTLAQGRDANSVADRVFRTSRIEPTLSPSRQSEPPELESETNGHVSLIRPYSGRSLVRYRTTRAANTPRNRANFWVLRRIPGESLFPRRLSGGGGSQPPTGLQGRQPETKPNRTPSGWGESRENSSLEADPL